MPSLQSSRPSKPFGRAATATGDTERDLNQTAREILGERPLRGVFADGQRAGAAPFKPPEEQVLSVRDRVESRLVTATWTLRRLPDRERGFMCMRTMMWPDAANNSGGYAPPAMTSLQARRNARIDPKDIDQMQPTLDLLALLPDLTDRQIVFWAAWHQDGERSAKIPWAKVRRSMGCDLSRWTLKRRFEAGLDWLARLICLQS